MRKSERLFQLVTLLQGRRTAMTGQVLAEKLGTRKRGWGHSYRRARRRNRPRG